MTTEEKAEMLKSTISHLYSKEGRSISYISRLLDINRRTISAKIKEWGIPEPEPMKYIKSSTQKFINKNRNLIKSRLDNDIPMTEIAEELGIQRCTLQRTYINNDEVLKKAHDDYIKRMHDGHDERVEEAIKKSSRDYYTGDLDGEQWRAILGYDGYEVSNKGRVRHYAERYKAYILLKPNINQLTGRVYMTITADKKRNNFILARLVAYAFVKGYSEERNTVNHKDGDIMNNCSDNLEWVSQSENNKHAYDKLNRNIVRGKRYKFDRILYKDKYEFKTVAAFARFIGMSETQTRRYLDEPEKHDIKLIIDK